MGDSTTVVVITNVVAAVVLLLGGLIGFVKKGSTASLAASTIFSATLMLSAFLINRNRNTKHFRGFVIAGTSGFLLVVLFMMRVLVQGVALKAPVMSVLAVGSIVSIVNVIALLRAVKAASK